MYTYIHTLASDWWKAVDYDKIYIDPAEAVAYMISFGVTRLRLLKPRVHHKHHSFLEV